jgi:hypothetical protein
MQEKFFNLVSEFEKWKLDTKDWLDWEIDNYQSFGTITSKEAKNFFSELKKHCLPFCYKNVKDDFVKDVKKYLYLLILLYFKKVKACTFKKQKNM